jgi:capsid protein
LGSVRWVVKSTEEYTNRYIHSTESEAVKHAIFLNDTYKTDTYYVEKSDKKEI